ncbi:MAG: Rrf2 family transcriptional regulator [Actinobacteria bacterium]|nr:Rrf2 family transcriptional regulator [Actinomycetota bacterium]
MKFSARSEYALRAMIDLANNDHREVIGVKEIAARQNVPERFLEQQMTTLRKAGLVNSQRGAAGGVSLARTSDKITIAEIIEALEGHLTPVTCVVADAPDCAKSAHCAVRDLLCKVDLAVKEVLRKTTLANLASNQSRYDQSKHPMYYI